MLLSAVSVLVVAQSSSEIPEGLMNNPVYSDCVFVALVINHRKLMRHIVIYDLPGSTLFFHIISQRARFSKKKILNTKCVFYFSLQRLAKIFLILRTIEQVMIKNVYRSSCKVPVILVRF